MQTLELVYSHQGGEQPFSAEPFIKVGVPPTDEASFVLVEEALRNAIRELEQIESSSTSIRSDRKTTNSIAGRFFENLIRTGNGEHSLRSNMRERKLRSEILEIFAAEQKQRALIEQRLIRREALRKQPAEPDSN